MPGPPLTLEEINALDRDQFVARLGPVFESSPWIAAEAWHGRPFESVERLHETMCEVMYGASPEQKLVLIRAHPDLVGRAALAGTLSPESKGEQASAGLDHLSPEEVVEFTRLNSLYHDKFDFPFVICARENKKENILAGFTARLRNSREQEIATALAEIAKIARLRLLDVVKP
jgi:OHCU decarboxylase